MIAVNVAKSKKNAFDTDFKVCESAEARICTECPLPNCIETKSGKCKRYQQELRRLKGK